MGRGMSQSQMQSAQLTWFDWCGKELNSSVRKFTVPTLNNSLIFEASGLDSILPAGSNATDVWTRLNLTAETDSGTVTNEQYVTSNAIHLV
ncbi:hypothetical protein DFH11DRAFT_1641953 [Phellopilus nigrolimitatus]|nr:hypothetical protein DFH11DRAFT_1641953 [Phellopilus nigrolimitatus]